MENRISTRKFITQCPVYRDKSYYQSVFNQFIIVKWTKVHSFTKENLKILLRTFLTGVWKRYCPHNGLISVPNNLILITSKCVQTKAIPRRYSPHENEKNRKEFSRRKSRISKHFKIPDSPKSIRKFTIWLKILQILVICPQLGILLENTF